eukprot:scpid109477/ scgid17006/ 
MNTSSSTVASSDEYSLFHTSAGASDVPDTRTVASAHVDPYMCTLRIDNIPTVFEIDTGAAVTIINDAEYRRLSSKSKIELETDNLLKLRTYNGKILPVQGRFVAR